MLHCTSIWSSRVAMLYATRQGGPKMMRSSCSHGQDIRHLPSCSLHVHEMLIMLRARRIAISYMSPVHHPVSDVQGINAIIFYAPVLFEQIGGQGLGNLLNTVVIDAGEAVIMHFLGLFFAFPCPWL